jgi:hypothetical protein
MSSTPVARATAALCWLIFSNTLVAQTYVHGHITDAATGAPVTTADIRVEAAGPFDYLVAGYATLESDGTYQWDGICSPFYFNACRVHVESIGYVDGYGSFDATQTDVEVDIALDHPASLGGHVRWAADTAPASGIFVTAACMQSDESACIDDPFCSATTDAEGAFVIHGIVPGTYQVCAVAPLRHSVPQCYDHLDQGSFAESQPYTPLALDAGEIVDSVDFDISTGGTLAGTLHDGYRNAPLAQHSIDFIFFDANGAWYAIYETTTGDDGRYALPGIPEGSYYVEASELSYPFSDYAQLYPGIGCLDGSCPPVTSSQLLTLSTGATLDGIDFTFHPIATISGHVVDAADGSPLGGIRVQALDCRDEGCSTAGPFVLSQPGTGTFSLDVPDSPGIHVFTASGSPYVDLVYPDVPCVYGQNCDTQGQALAVQAGDHLESIDFSMEVGGSASGSVATLRGGIGADAAVIVYDLAFNVVWSGYADNAGGYASAALPPGTYYVSADNGWGCSFYRDRPCPPDGQDPSTSQPTPIVLTQGEVTEHVDFTLPAPDPIFESGFEY